MFRGDEDHSVIFLFSQFTIRWQRKALLKAARGSGFLHKRLCSNTDQSYLSLSRMLFKLLSDYLIFLKKKFLIGNVITIQSEVSSFGKKQ